MPSPASARFASTLVRLHAVLGVSCVFGSLAEEGVATPFTVMVDTTPDLSKVPADALDFGMGGGLLHTLTTDTAGFATAVSDAGHTFDSLVGLSLVSDGTRNYRVKAVAVREESTDLYVHTTR